MGSGEVLLAVVAIAALVLRELQARRIEKALDLAARDARVALDRTNGVARNAIEELARITREANAQLAIAKGAHPHHAAPGTFSPSGAAWSATEKYEEQTRKIVERSRSVEDDERIQELLRDAEEARELGMDEEAVRSIVRTRQGATAGAGQKGDDAPA